MKIRPTTIILFVVCLAGFVLLAYPSFSNYWNQNFTTRLISDYHENIANIKDDEYEKIWQEAKDYNRTIAQKPNSVHNQDMKARYKECLSLNGSDMMGFIEIPAINVTLSIGHGTGETVLSSAVGHVDWSSLPTGGEDTHCVLSGHRGLPSAKLFTDLDKLREGDVFVLTILNETLTYEIDQIRTVLPDDSKDLQIEKGKDYCTLLTCTPYGINTHRLLVRGHRIANIVVGANVTSEAVLIDQIIVAMFLAIPLLFVLMLMVLFKKPEKPKDKNKMLKEYVAGQDDSRQKK